jgi:serine/threonine-protein kinase
MADARLELEERGAETMRPAEQRVSILARWRWIAPLAVVALVGIAGVQTWRLMGVAAVTPTPVRFSIVPPPGWELGIDGNPLAVMSPDGTRIVFAYRRGSDQQLFTRRFDENEARPIPGTEGGSRPFFSPDGRWIAFHDERNALKKVAVDGGAAVVIAVSDFGTGAWAPDDTIVFTPSYNAGLSSVSASGGMPRKLTRPTIDDGELGHWWPQILPDGESVLFTSFRTPAERSRIEVYSLKTGKRKVVADGGFFGRYAASGHLLFNRSTTVMAARFDLKRQETISPAVPVLAGVAVTFPNGQAQYSVSSTGTLAYVSQAALHVPRQLVWLDRTGKPSAAGDARKRFEDPRLSPDGRRVALTIRDENDADIWVYDLSRQSFDRITSSPTTQFSPVWTPDARRLFFVFEEPVFHIYSRAVDGGAEPERVLDGPIDVIPLAVSPDGRFLVYQRNDPSTRGGVWLLPLSGDPKPRPFVDTSFREQGGALSPDAQWLAYVSDETGRDEVYLQAFPDRRERVSVSTNGGRAPKWSRDGREVFWREGDKMMVAYLRDGTIGRPSMLFEKRMEEYDVAPDGRFLAVLPDEGAPPAPVSVVLNFFEELKRLVPTK